SVVLCTRLYLVSLLLTVLSYCDFHLIFHLLCLTFFFFTARSLSQIYTLSLHDALPISAALTGFSSLAKAVTRITVPSRRNCDPRSEEHTSELQSLRHLVGRLLLEKKKKKI